MLKRPGLNTRSSIALSIVSIFAIFLLLDSLWTMHANTKSYGLRKTYAYVEKEIGSGEVVDQSKLVAKSMFEKDAPKNSIEFSKISSTKYAYFDIPSHVILTKEMISNSSDEINSEKRIVFIPTESSVKNKSKKVDLISITEYGSEVIATNSTVISNADSESSKGLYVLVNVDEAGQVAEALASGHIYFSFIPY